MRLLGLAVGISLAMAAQAANVSVMPVGLTFSVGHDRSAITVTNEDAENAVMQVEAVAWTQADGQDVYTPTQDLLVNPPIFAVKPGHAQVLRVGLRQPPTGEREVAYRLILREVPQPPASSGSAPHQGQVRVLLQMRLPVYVAPAQIVPGQQWHARRTEEGAVELSLTNTGNVHVVVGELKLRAAGTAASAPPLATLKSSVSVLPGQSNTWQFAAGMAMPDRRYVVEVVTDRGPRDVALDPGHL